MHDTDTQTNQAWNRDVHHRMLRINVVGTSGAGKTTFARQLARQLDYPLVELDQLYWEAGWRAASDEDFYGRIKQATSQPRWILDGNYSRTEPIKWRNATMIIWLDYSFARTLSQAFRRAIRRCWTKQEIWPGTGNRESFRRTFLSHQSILLWTIHSFHRVRKRYATRMVDPRFSHIEFVRLGSPKAAQQFLMLADSAGEAIS